MQQTSLSLLARVQQSPQADSWHDLVQLYTPLIRSWLIHYQVQDADADDLTQEVLTTVSQEIARFDHNHRTGAFGF